MLRLCDASMLSNRITGVLAGSFLTLCSHHRSCGRKELLCIVTSSAALTAAVCHMVRFERTARSPKNLGSSQRVSIGIASVGV